MATYFDKLNCALALFQATGPDLRTAQFTELVDRTLDVFDVLGVFMGFAKTEASGKCTTLKDATPRCPTLLAVVAADKRTGTVMKKNSCARNLHRLMLMVSFISLLMEQLMAYPPVTLRDAAQKAYSGSLSPYQPFVMRGAIKAGFFALPSREAFLKALGETEDTAYEQARIFTEGAKEVVTQMQKLYDCPMM